MTAVRPAHRTGQTPPGLQGDAGYRQTTRRMGWRNFYWSSSVRAEEWLLIEWPEGDVEPLKYFMSTAPENATLEQLVFVTKMRWRIERDYQDLKQEFGLGHYEGRGWRGFHHHASLSIAAYGFLMAQRLGTDSYGDSKKNGAKFSLPATN